MGFRFTNNHPTNIPRVFYLMITRMSTEHPVSFAFSPVTDAWGSFVVGFRIWEDGRETVTNVGLRLTSSASTTL